MNIDKKELKQTIKKTKLLKEDFELLKEGHWIPDDDSCNSSLDNLDDILDFLKKLK